ncbi:hypothetical protein RG47T_0053 [Mucilaginibacter polytrichastri]|uniref:Uncharacterized protein n=1 Tax=Mucilaginibacter polytrichastri TaxID=1302689 RepID=A0A1Q5ZS69_9SPHI|nr:hypothetical protein RG47T_0053 [Mucilaginibacter polytrichastri]
MIPIATLFRIENAIILSNINYKKLIRILKSHAKFIAGGNI